MRSTWCSRKVPSGFGTAVIILSIVAAGCGGQSTGTVTGTVTYLDKGIGGKGAEKISFSTLGALTNDLYEVTLLNSGANGVRDIAGNYLSGSISEDFAVAIPSLAKNLYVGAAYFLGFMGDNDVALALLRHAKLGFNDYAFLNLHGRLAYFQGEPVRYSVEPLTAMFVLAQEVQDCGRERKPFDPLGSPLGADFLARHAPDLLRVGLEKCQIQLAAETVDQKIF